MKINLSDIDVTTCGFSVEKIKKLSDKKLNQLDKKLSEEVRSVNWTSIDDMGHLVVSWIHSVWLEDEQKQKICDILNELLA